MAATIGAVVTLAHDVIAMRTETIHPRQTPPKTDIKAPSVDSSAQTKNPADVCT